MVTAAAVNSLATVMTSGIVSIVVFVVGTWINAKITGGVQHDYDRKLEALRKQTEQDLDRLRAQIKARDEQVAALRSGALANMAARHATLGEKRIEAIETLWAAVVESGKFKFLAKLSESIRWDVALDSAVGNSEEAEKMRLFGDSIWKLAGLEGIKDLGADPNRVRPFVSPLVWAKFSAYRHVLSLPIAQWSALKTGVGKKMLADPEPMIDMVKSILAHQAPFLDEHGVGGLPFLVDELESALLREVVESLNDQELDNASVKQAADILAFADKVGPMTKAPPEVPEAIKVGN